MSDFELAIEGIMEFCKKKGVWAILDDIDSAGAMIDVSILNHRVGCWLVRNDDQEAVVKEFVSFIRKNLLETKEKLSALLEIFVEPEET